MPSVLPHRYPFLLLDRITSVQPGRSANARRLVTHDDMWVDANRSMPSSLLAEIMAQCAGVALAGQGPMVGVLAKIDRFRCRGAGVVGATLDVHVRIVKTFGATVKARGLIRMDGRRWAAAELVLQLVNPSVA